MAAHVGDVREKTAAEILVSFRNRELVRWPEWVPRPGEGELAAEEVVKMHRLEWWNRQQRSRPSREPALPAVLNKALKTLGLKVYGGEDMQAPSPLPTRERMMVKVKVKTELKAARRPGSPPEYGVGAGSGASFSREGVVARSLPCAVVKAEPPATAARLSESPPYYIAAAGSVSSTSGGGGDRALPRPRPSPSEKAHVKTVPTAGKEAMEASSPETPLDYAAAAGSGTSSSGEDAAQSSRKRKAPGAGGSSGDEGCSSPEKRAHLVATAGGAQTAAAKAEGAKFADALNRNEKGVLIFDLNECPDNCEDWS
ncbi:hypothetical protein E2562_036910 [Oryza meyeriana var. granulata]|uniref:Uncharacterized protein n=1 Tax=Oryza meyeriana var. granulata TaxID=110450 RepID=A0A6G1CL60_9ORYZ|nr:hypothetical protein E2562_036910 [Oryza meyeriana var. granulata]